MKPQWILILGGLLLIAAGLMFAATSPSTLAQDPPLPTPIPDPVGERPAFLGDIYDAWVQSPHADTAAEAFIHWNEDGAVEARCATCHSTPGYQDFLGADGSEAGVVDAPAALGSVINCDACHNDVSTHLTSVTFPSGVELTNLNDAARCMVCHQGRSSSVTVNNAIANAGVEPNVVSEDLSFINIHYYAAAASLYGSEVHGGYEFDGNLYQRRFLHVDGYDTCIDCHDPHTLEIKVDECVVCHENVESVEDIRNIRMAGSLTDYDGDGDMAEGLAGEIETLQATLYTTIQAYASEIVGLPIVYDVHSHPYFFIDTNADGVTDADEVNGDNRFNAFTPRLLQATYNYQVSLKDPGAYVHNAKYHIELLYDSIMMLNMELGVEMGDTQMSRNDPGHFDSTGEPFRHWDADGEVPATCAKCHTSDGLPFFMDNGVNIASEPSNSLACTTCHDNIGEFTVYSLEEVTFPSGSTASFGEGEPSNLCLNCHQGRESTVSVNNVIARAGVGDDEVTDALTFRNVHYFAAGASMFGGDVQGAYQYEGKEYVGQFEHVNRYDQCIECHDQHELGVRSNLCAECHENVESPEDLRLIRQEAEDVDPVDYDGDGEDEEPVADEIETFQNALYAQIQLYAANTVGTAIVYDSHSHPYWFIDTNGNGLTDPEEVNGDNRYVTWTPNLLRAAYNYQYSIKDPGGFAHNADYILQTLYDSIESVGGSEAIATFTRPPLRDD